MSEQDPTSRITVDEQRRVAISQGRRRPEPYFIPIFLRPSDLTGDLADDTMAGLMSRPFTYTPPDRQAERAVREALPIGAPGIEVEQVLAAMPAWQSQAATLRALNALVADQYVTRQQDHGQRSAFHRPIPHPSRTDHASTSPPSRFGPALMAATMGRGKSTVLASAMARRRALYDAIRNALPTCAPGITTQEVQRRIGGDVVVGRLEMELSQMVAVRAIVSHQDGEDAATYHRAGEVEQR